MEIHRNEWWATLDKKKKIRVIWRYMIYDRKIGLKKIDSNIYLNVKCIKSCEAVFQKVHRIVLCCVVFPKR